VIVALLALGLVGMHHLVVAACHHGATAHASMLASDVTVGHSLLDPSSPAPAQAPHEAPDGAPGGLVGAAATCLAILLMIIGLVLPRIVSRVRYLTARDLCPRTTHVSARFLDPPDLTLLSVSRT
jgi:hypothetical protein